MAARRSDPLHARGEHVARAAHGLDQFRIRDVALDLAPQRTEVWTTIGEAYEAEGNYSRAAEAFNLYGSSCADCRAEAAALLAHTYALEHKLPQARTELAYARLHPRDVDQTDLAAAVAASREALVNAAKHAEVSGVSLYAEVESDAVSIFVKDRGVGFDPDAVADDRQGVRGSIVGRIERHGGTVQLRTAPGSGTEVQIRMPVS